MTVASTGARRQLESIARSQPETATWLALYRVALDAGENPAWDIAAAATTLHPAPAEPGPLLTGATVPIPPGLVADLFDRLFRAVAGNDRSTGAFRDAVAEIDLTDLLQAAINQDGGRVYELATGAGVDTAALAAIAQLATLPPLQALRRRFAATVPSPWDHGFCPVCGAWPVLAEVRGLERARRLRCGRCGGDWGMMALRCPFCLTHDHRQIGSLIPADGGEARRVETCDHCHGYIKTVTTLRGWAGDEVGLADLSSIDLDLAALERDYARPDAPALDLAIRLVRPDENGQ